VFAFYAGHPVGYGGSLSAALAQVFGGSVPGQSTPGGPSGGTVNARVIADLKQAQRFYAQAQAALRNGDLAAYAQAITKMAQQISNAQADAQAGKATTSPKTGSGAGPAPSPTPTTSR
jgi:uncharacterized membrane protein (UPF0182 family)